MEYSIRFIWHWKKINLAS